MCFNHWAPYFTIKDPNDCDLVHKREFVCMVLKWKEPFDTFNAAKLDNPSCNQFIFSNLFHSFKIKLMDLSTLLLFWHKDATKRYVGVSRMKSIRKNICSQPSIMLCKNAFYLDFPKTVVVLCIVFLSGKCTICMAFILQGIYS